MTVRIEIPATVVAESRKARKRDHLLRKRLARGKTMFKLAHPEGDWKSLDVSEQYRWVAAFREAQADFDRNAGVLAGAAKLARSLHMYDTSKGRDYIMFERAFIGLPTIEQMWLMDLFVACESSFRRNSVQKLSTTIEMQGDLGSQVAEQLVVYCTHVAKGVDEANPGSHLKWTVKQTTKRQ